MKMIGITGGVGAGKSKVLDYLSGNPRFLVRKADEIGHLVMEKGTPVFERIVNLLGGSVIGDDGNIDRSRMGELIFKDPLVTEKINGIIHPAVREYVEKDKLKDPGNMIYIFLKRHCLLNADMIKYAMGYGIFMLIKKSDEKD